MSHTFRFTHTVMVFIFVPFLYRNEFSLSRLAYNSRFLWKFAMSAELLFIFFCNTKIRKTYMTDSMHHFVVQAQKK